MNLSLCTSHASVIYANTGAISNWRSWWHGHHINKPIKGQIHTKPMTSSHSNIKISPRQDHVVTPLPLLRKQKMITKQTKNLFSCIYLQIMLFGVWYKEAKGHKQLFIHRLPPCDFYQTKKWQLQFFKSALLAGFKSDSFPPASMLKCPILQ